MPAVDQRLVIGICHAAADVPRYYPAADLDELRTQAEVRILGSQDRAAILPQLGDVDILSSSWGMPRLDEELLAAAPRLGAACYAAGSVKGFATAASFARGVVITTAMHANAIPVAETTMALITLAARNWFWCQANIRANGREGWRSKTEPSFTGLFGITIGLVGFGAIGRLVLERLRSAEVRVLVHDPHADPAAIRAAGGEPATLHELAAASRIVSLHAANIPATRRMIDAAFLAAMPDGAVLINTARGALIDETALLVELESGRICAHLDVTDPEPPVAGSPLYRLPNVWLTPHRAGSCAQEIQRMGRYAIAECLRLIRGEPVRYGVTQDMLATMA